MLAFYDSFLTDTHYSLSHVRSPLTLHSLTHTCFSLFLLSLHTVFLSQDASFQHYFDRHAQELWLTTSLPAGLTSTDVLAAALSQLLAPGHSLALAPLLLVPEEEADAAAAQLGLLSRQVRVGNGVSLGDASASAIPPSPPRSLVPARSVCDYLSRVAAPCFTTSIPRCSITTRAVAFQGS